MARPVIMIVRVKSNSVQPEWAGTVRSRKSKTRNNRPAEA